MVRKIGQELSSDGQKYKGIRRIASRAKPTEHVVGKVTAVEEKTLTHLGHEEGKSDES
jgi:hypothetical protein